MTEFEVILRQADGSGREARFAFALDAGQQVLFGRSPDADIVIPDHNRKVSSRHGRIVGQPDGSLRGFDLASLNGTYLHGAALDTETGERLADGDRLRVGDFELVVVLTPATAAAGPATTTAEPGGQTLEAVQAPEVGQAPEIGGPARGSSPASEHGALPLIEPAVAPGSGRATGARPTGRGLARPAAPGLWSGPLLEAVDRAYAESLHQDAATRSSRISAALAAGLGTLPAEQRGSATAALVDSCGRVDTCGSVDAGREHDDHWCSDGHGASAPDYSAPDYSAPDYSAPDYSAPDYKADSTADSEADEAAPLESRPAGNRAAAHVGGAGAGAAAATTGGSTPVDHLQLLALRLVPGLQLVDAEQRARFLTLIAQLCESALDWMSRALEGRAVFGQEFGAEVTLVFQRSTNPLKAMSREELQRYLLDWTDAAPAETRRHYLTGVLEDLHEHQVGVLAGVEEAISGVLTRLAPERIDGLAAQQKAKGWTAATRAWQTYCQLHQELVEERSKLFHELISPAIQKGYLHRHGDRNGDAATP